MSPTPDDNDQGRTGARSDEPAGHQRRPQPAREPGGRAEPRPGQARRSESTYSKEFAEAVGRTIKVLRTDLGIERRELAAAVGISYSYLTEIENGNKPASATVLRPLAHALGLRLSQLTEAAERRIEALDQPLTLNMLAPSATMDDLATPARRPSPTVDLSPVQESAAMRPSLRGQYHELRAAILELERLLERMAPDDIERLLDYGRRLSR